MSRRIESFGITIVRLFLLQSICNSNFYLQLPSVENLFLKSDSYSELQMNFPRICFAPAGNTDKGLSSIELIDLNEIFHGMTS